MDDPLLQETVTRIVDALKTIFSPGATAQERRVATEFVENFKETSDHCATCGLALFSQPGENGQIRHVGIQFAEHFVRTKWNTLTQDNKEEFKSRGLNMILHAENSEPGHLKDALAKFVVELIKREWPQHWGSLFTDLGRICQYGDAQTEIVLLVLLRLAEDVVCFDSNLQQKRRRDMLQTLNENMEELLEFMLSTMQGNFTMYQKGGHPLHFRLCEAAVFTLQGYLDWIHLKYLFILDNMLLQVICSLLKEPKLRLPAIDCLTLAVGRKGDIHQRRGFLILFSDDAMSMFVELARNACQAEATSENYMFLKKLAEALASLGYTQLATIWDGDKGICKAPDNFGKYLEVITELTSHPGVGVGVECTRVWSSFLKHAFISKENALLALIPNLLTALWTSITKFGHPSRTDHPRCVFSKLEFDSDEDFLNEFSHLRFFINQNIQECTELFPVQVFEETYKLFEEQLHKSLAISYMETVTNGNKAMAYLKVEGQSTFLSHVMKKLMTLKEVWNNPDESARLVQTSRKFLALFLEFHSKAPLLMQCILSCIVSLVPMLSFSVQQIPQVLQKIFTTMAFEMNPEIEPLGFVYSKQVVSLRRHSATCLLDLCRDIPDLLKAYFDDLEMKVSELLGADEKLRYERVTCVEALILLSYNFSDSTKLQGLLLKVFTPILEFFREETMRRALEIEEDFVRHLGFDRPVEASQMTFLSKLLEMANIALGTVRRCKIPVAIKDEVEASSSIAEASIKCQYPWTAILLEMLQNVFMLLRQLNLLWKPENRGLVHASNNVIFDLHIAEKYSILGFSATTADYVEDSQGTSAQLKYILFTIPENLTNFLGHCGISLGYSFYGIPNLDQIIINNIVETWCWLPMWRLKNVLRLFIKPFLLNCPKQLYIPLVVPVMGKLMSYMFAFLDEKWQKVVKQKEEGGDSEEEELQEEMIKENKIDQELIEERSLYHLHKDYIEVLLSASATKVRQTTLDNASLQVTELADLGKLLIESEATCKSFVFTVFSSIAWPDFAVVSKLSLLIPSITDKIVELCKISPIDSTVIDTLLLCILKGLRLHGSDSSTRSNLLQAAYHFYYNMRLSFPSLASVMMLVPSCAEEKLKEFESIIFDDQLQKTPKLEKKRREMFKSMLSGTLQPSVSEWHKRLIKIEDLPPLAPRRRPRNQNILQNPEDIALCSLFTET